MTRAVRTLVGIAVVIGLALVLGTLGVKRLAHRPAAPQPLDYYVLQQRQIARFAIISDTPLHVSMRVPLGGDALPARYQLAVRLVARDGQVLATRALDLPIRASTSADDDSANTSAIDGVTVTPVADTAWLELEAANPPVAVRVTRAIARRGSLERGLIAAGVDPTWLGPDELHALDISRTEVVPAVGDFPVASFARATSRPRREPPRVPAISRRMVVDARQRAAFNLVGPGRAVVRVEGEGTFDVTLVGARDERDIPVEANTTAPIELPAGVTSLVIAAHGLATGTPSVQLDGARMLDGGPAAHRTPAHWLPASGSMEFPIRGALPIRIVARGVGDARGALGVQLLDGTKAAVDATRTLEPSATPDPFTAAEQPGRHEPLRSETTLIVLPPPAARTVRVTATMDVIVAVDVRIEDASDPSPAPPYDVVVPPGLRFVDVPAKAASWFPLTPDGARPPHGVAWTLVRSPRLVPHVVPVARSTVGVQPRNGGAAVELREPAFDRTRADSVIVATGTPTPLIIAETGVHARVLRLRCEANGRLGGDLLVRVDGRDAKSTPLVTDRVDVTIPVSPGPHLVELAGSPVTCTAHARTSSRISAVARHAFRIDPRDGVQLSVVRSSTPTTVSCAMYTATSATSLDVESVVDGGAPTRRTGEVQRITTGRRSQTVPLADGVVLASGGRALKRALVHVAVGDDLADGRHVVSIRALEHGPLWARCWMPGERSRTEQVTTWFTTED